MSDAPMTARLLTTPCRSSSVGEPVHAVPAPMLENTGLIDARG
jgi:hypothetical protein